MNSAQEQKIYAAGEHVAQSSWEQNGRSVAGLERDYLFTARGDAEYIEQVAAKLGVPVDDDVWAAARAGYRSAYDLIAASEREEEERIERELELQHG